MNAYVHYLLVNPDYHGNTIGRTLVDKIKEYYKDYMRVAVIAYDNEAHFYEHCGFKKATTHHQCSSCPSGHDEACRQVYSGAVAESIFYR